MPSIPPLFPAQPKAQTSPVLGTNLPLFGVPPTAPAAPAPAPQSLGGFTPAGPVHSFAAPPAPTSTPWSPFGPAILKPNPRQGFSLARIYLTADFQVAALRLFRRSSDGMVLAPTFELISRLPEPPSIPRGYVELVPQSAFDVSVLGLAQDTNAVVHLLPPSDSMSISADFVSMQPLVHNPLPTFEMKEVVRRPSEPGGVPSICFQIAAVDLNNHFEVTSVLLYRLFDASVMASMSRPFDITSIQLDTEFQLRAVQLARTLPGRRSVLTGAGSQSTPTAPGVIEFQVTALQLSQRFEIESLMLHPGLRA
jgi:hypothetical protein